MDGDFWDPSSSLLVCQTPGGRDTGQCGVAAPGIGESTSFPCCFLHPQDGFHRLGQWCWQEKGVTMARYLSSVLDLAHGSRPSLNFPAAAATPPASAMVKAPV